MTPSRAADLRITRKQRTNLSICWDVFLELETSEAGYLTGNHSIAGGLIWVLRAQWPTEFLPPLPRVRNRCPQHSLQHDLGLNSADSIDLVFALEDMFEIEAPDQDFRKFTTVAEVIRYVEGRLRRT